MERSVVCMISSGMAGDEGGGPVSRMERVETSGTSMACMVGSKRSECGTDREREARRQCLRPPRRCTGGAAYGPLWRARLDRSSPHSPLHGSPPPRPLLSRALPHPTVFHRAQNVGRFRSFACNVKSSNAGTVRSKRARSAGTYTGAYIREYKQTIPYLRHRSRRSYVL